MKSCQKEQQKRKKSDAFSRFTAFAPTEARLTSFRSEESRVVCMITAGGRLRLPGKALDMFPAARSLRGPGRETTVYFICGQWGESTVQFPNHPKKVQERGRLEKVRCQVATGLFTTQRRMRLT